jgi:hypothetical protein
MKATIKTYVTMPHIACELMCDAVMLAELFSEMGYGLSRDGTIQLKERWLADLNGEISDGGRELIRALAAALAAEGGEA